LKDYFCEEGKRAVVISSSMFLFYSAAEKIYPKLNQIIRYILINVSALFLCNNMIATKHSNAEAGVQSQQ